MQAALSNRSLFCCDNMQALRGFNSDSVDLIYLDPPFNKNKVFRSSVSSPAHGASFRDIFRQEDVKQSERKQLEKHPKPLAALIESISQIGHPSPKYYLMYMAIRLLALHRILKQTGSLYLHCDPTMSHYLKLLLDGIFGAKNFRNEIIWCYDTPSNARGHFPRKHDTILVYGKSKGVCFDADAVRVPYKRGRKLDGKGWTRPVYSAAEVAKGKVVPDWWKDCTPVQRLARERMGYPTQKPLKLLERIIQASTKKGDWVLDPFCGCATTCVAAERLGRRWIGIDVSFHAYVLAQYRLQKEAERSGNPSAPLLRIGQDAYVQRSDLQADKRPLADIKQNVYDDQSGCCAHCDTKTPSTQLKLVCPLPDPTEIYYEHVQLLCDKCLQKSEMKAMTSEFVKKPVETTRDV